MHISSACANILSWCGSVTSPLLIQISCLAIPGPATNGWSSFFSERIACPNVPAPAACTCLSPCLRSAAEQRSSPVDEQQLRPNEPAPSIAPCACVDKRSVICAYVQTCACACLPAAALTLLHICPLHTAVLLPHDTGLLCLRWHR